MMYMCVPCTCTCINDLAGLLHWCCNMHVHVKHPTCRSVLVLTSDVSDVFCYVLWARVVLHVMSFGVMMHVHDDLMFFHSCTCTYTGVSTFESHGLGTVL